MEEHYLRFLCKSACIEYASFTTIVTRVVIPKYLTDKTLESWEVTVNISYN